VSGVHISLSSIRLLRVIWRKVSGQNVRVDEEALINLNLALIQRTARNAAGHQATFSVVYLPMKHERVPGSISLG